MFGHKKIPHVSVLVQAVNQTYTTSKQKLLSGQPQHKVTELQKLWDNICQTPDAVTGCASCEALLSLVASGQLSIEDVLHNIVNITPSSKCVKWLIHLAMGVLKLEFTLSATKCSDCKVLCYKSPYQLRSNPHPFISLIVSAPQSWVNILSEIQTLLFDWNDGVGLNDSNIYTISNALEVLRPFFVYILCNPSGEHTTVFQATNLFNLLLSQYHTGMCSNTAKPSSCKHVSIEEFLIDMLTCMSLTEENLQLFVQLVTVVKSKSHFSSSDHFADMMCLRLLSSCSSMMKNQVLSPTVHLMCRFINSVSHLLDNVCIMSIGLSHLICQSCPEALKWLLHTTLEILEIPNWINYSYTTRILCLCSLKAALLQLLLNKQSLGFVKLQTLMHSTLSKINSQLGKLTARSEDTTEQTSLSSKKFNKLRQNHFINSWLSGITMIVECICNVDEYWLCNVHQILEEKGDRDMIVTAVLIYCGTLICHSLNTDAVDDKMFLYALKLLQHCASALPEITLTILPTLLYSLKLEQNPIIQKNVMLALPQLAVEQECIAPVLGTIQAMCEVQALLPLATYLLLQLWRKQERCFPYLQKMISQKLPFHLAIDRELATVKAVTVCDICRTRPFKNSSEMLDLITSMLKAKVHGGQAALLLEGLYHLLINEVVDVHTTWFALGDTIKSYKSPSVIKQALKLISVVPKVEIESPAFVQFKDEVISWVWSHVEHPNSGIVGAALVSLAHFRMEDFTVKHLPIKLRPRFEETNASEELMDEFLSKPIPGYTYLRLVTTSQMAEQGQYFFSSLLDQEILNMPRDIKHRALQSQKRSSHSSAVSGIPNFILKMYERNKQPNLKSSFATALLMCYDPLSDGGNSAPKTLVSLSRNVLQILQALLSEVTVDAKNWQSVLWLTHAWKMFMQRCFSLMVKGRCAELELQLRQKNCNKEEVEHKLFTVEFWCRDKITELLKTASKGTPSMQGNAALALSSLMCALKSNKLKSVDKPEVGDSSGYLSYDHWTGMAADTIISIVDQNYKSPGRIFSWCQYRAVSRTGRLSTSQLGKVCAMHSLSIMIPALLPNDTNRIGSVISLLLNHMNNVLCESNQTDRNPMTNLHVSIATGSTVAKLYSEKFHEACDGMLKHQLDMCVSVMSTNIFEEKKSTNTDDGEDSFDDEESDNELCIGAVLGIGIALTSMFSCGNITLKEIAVTIVFKLLELVEKLDDKPALYLQAFYSAMVWACVAGQNVVANTTEFYSKTLEKVNKIFLETKNNVAFSQSLAILCYYGPDNTAASSLLYKLYHQWNKQASDERLPTRQKLSSISGLAALVGSEAIFTSYKSEDSPQLRDKKSQLIETLQRFTRNGKDSGIASNSILLLGHLYMSSQDSPSQSLNVPSSLEYLPETSILRPMFNVLQNHAEDPCYQTLYKVVLKSLSEVASTSCKPLPPVNWSGVMSSLLSMNLTNNEKKNCFQIIISQCKENASAASLLSKWVQPPLFKTLQTSAQCIILKSLDVFIRNSPSATVLSFMNTLMPIFLSDTTASLSHYILIGLRSALKMSDLPKDVPSCLFSLIGRIMEEYNFSLDYKVIEQWEIIADCVAECEESNLKINSTASPQVAMKELFVKTHLISQGLRPLQFCNGSIESCARCCNLDMKKSSLWILNRCFKNLIHSKSDTSVLTKRLEWMQELMTKIQKHDVTAEFFLKVFSICVITWSNFSNWATEGGNLDAASCLTVTVTQQKDFLWDQCLVLFPSSLKFFLSKIPSEDLTRLSIEWLVHLHQHTFKNSEKRAYLSQALLELKDTKMFINTSLWTSVAAAILL